MEKRPSVVLRTSQSYQRLVGRKFSKESSKIVHLGASLFPRCSYYAANASAIRRPCLRTVGLASMKPNPFVCSLLRNVMYSGTLYWVSVIVLSANCSDGGAESCGKSRKLPKLSANAENKFIAFPYRVLDFGVTKSRR